MPNTVADSLPHYLRRHTVELFARRVMIIANGCWIWTGAKDPRGYGIFSYWVPETKSKISERAHRFSFRARFGNLPDQLDHIVCDNPSCVNPDHLVATTTRDNVLRSKNKAALNARKTHCLNGHELSGGNLAMKSGKRTCKICRRKDGKVRYDREFKDRFAPRLSLPFPQHAAIELTREDGNKECGLCHMNPEIGPGAEVFLSIYDKRLLPFQAGQQDPLLLRIALCRTDATSLRDQIDAALRVQYEPTQGIESPETMHSGDTFNEITRTVDKFYRDDCA